MSLFLTERAVNNNAKVRVVWYYLSLTGAWAVSTSSLFHFFQIITLDGVENGRIFCRVGGTLDLNSLNIGRERGGGGGEKGGEMREKELERWRMRREDKREREREREREIDR